VSKETCVVNTKQSVQKALDRIEQKFAQLSDNERSLYWGLLEVDLEEQAEQLLSQVGPLRELRKTSQQR
jgi:hypothetical protein